MDERESYRSSDNHKDSNDGSSRHKSKWGLSTAVHSVGFVAKKVVNNRLTDSLWSAKKSSSGSSSSSDASSAVNDRETSHLDGKRVIDKSENENSKRSNDLDNHCQLEDSTLPDDSNVSTTGSNVIDESENLKTTDESNVSTTSFNDIDDGSENTKLKPADGSHVKPVNQHRSPSMSVFNVVRPVSQHRWASTTANNVVDQSENTKPSDGSHTRLVNQHLWPGTVGSTVLNKSINHTDKPVRAPSARALNFVPAREVPARRGDSLAPSTRVKPFPIVRGVSLTPVARGVNHTPATRGVSLTPTTKKVDPPPSSTVELDPTSRGASPTPSARSASPRESNDSKTVSISTEISRVTRHVCPTPPTRSASPQHDIDTLIKPSSPRKSYNSDTDSISTEHDHSSNKGTDPTPTRGVGPTSHKPSGTRHFFKSSILSIFSKITDTKKDKNVDNLKEAFQNLELLYNIQVQWQFANAGAEAAFNSQRMTAEKSLSDLWRTILELRDSISAKKIDMGLLILQLKLYAILHRQMAYIDEWSEIQRDYESALSATTNDLQARSLSVPIVGGVKVDLNALKLIIFSTIQVLHATLSCIQSAISKLDKTHFLASELANIALHERALLDECEIFLASAAPLQIEECSLRSYLIMSNRTSLSE